jgi:hypothetical protein
MKAIEKRLGDLERAAHPGEYVSLSFLSPDMMALPKEEKQRMVDAAQAKAGPHGELLLLMWPDDVTAPTVPGPTIQMQWDTPGGDDSDDD